MKEEDVRGGPAHASQIRVPAFHGKEVGPGLHVSDTKKEGSSAVSTAAASSGSGGWPGMEV